MSIKDDLRKLMEQETPRERPAAPVPVSAPVQSTARIVPAVRLRVPSIHACEYCKTRPCACERQGKLFLFPADEERTTELQRLVHPEARGISAEQYKAEEIERILPARKPQRRQQWQQNTRRTA